jgi:hypothetical protein
MTAIGAFSRARLEGAPDEERRLLLGELRHIISARLAHFADQAAYWRQVRIVIEELKQAGHDLWSHDYDGSGRELWGWDYMDNDRAGKLQIQFEYGGAVRTWWRDEEWRLGVYRAEEEE